MNNTSPLLSTKATRMVGRQRVRGTLELGQDNILRLYRKKDNSLIFEAPADRILFSAGTIVTSRLRLSTMGSKPIQAVRIGVPSSSTWIQTLQEHGAQEDPKHPEEKLDKIGFRAIMACLLVFACIFILALTLQ